MRRLLLLAAALALVPPLAVADAVSVVASGNVTTHKGGCTLPGTAYFEWTQGSNSGRVDVQSACYVAGAAFDPGECSGTATGPIRCDNGWAVVDLAADGAFSASFSGGTYTAWGTLTRVNG